MYSVSPSLEQRQFLKPWRFAMQGMVTPTPSTAGTPSAGGNTGMAGLLDRLADDLTFDMDRKAETEQALLEDLLNTLRKEARKIEEDAWKYAAPRSQPKLMS
ncbi:uncharacterized protein [Physcomitrium patens]|uniref:Uncharacterized protein n=1 Tax=Physcomitrium patens TaxID=3218 RepID=A0A7I4FPU5_PHYPA|nr:uncharacterized protein LOC112280953 isoform X2 [Physcomitrium patens]|eukprot:XP_024372707.1 uncharacterized protein LOC112280953 isoform X2 [Physcomitrella patens]